MNPPFLDRFDKWIGIQADTEAQQSLLRERFIVLKRQIPWLLAMLLANLIGLVLEAWSSPGAWTTPAAGLGAILFMRGLFWWRIRANRLCRTALRREMRKTLLVSIIYFSCAFVWTIHLYINMPEYQRIDVAVLAVLGALGASYALSRFPLASAVPLFVLALPFSCLTVLDPQHGATGVSLLLIVLVSLRLLKEENRNFEDLVRSFFALTAEKLRAIEAERVAVAEKARVAVIANTDSLTGVRNRRGFLAELHQMDPNERRGLALILLDLDGFKPINDTFGHSTVDALLIEVSRRLGSLPEAMLVSRLGGDEFGLMSKCAGEGEARLVAQRAIAVLGKPFLLDGRSMRISACAGVSCQQDDQVADALRRADLALYRAKQVGRGSVALFSPELHCEVERRTAIEQALREPSLATGLELAFQPIFDLASMQLTSLEALARWRHTELGWVSPAEFIPITEQISVLGEITNELLRRAAAHASGWPPAVTLSFNLSPVQLCSPGMAKNVLAIIAGQGLDPARLQVEVTETALVANIDIARATLNELRDHGVQIALDDFGAGYSSIRYLREIHFDCVKLDGTLISPLANDETAVRLLKGVLSLCRELGQDCVAEHIETHDQLQIVRELGCRYGQGYGLARPVDAATALDLIRIHAPAECREFAASYRQLANSR